MGLATERELLKTKRVRVSTKLLIDVPLLIAVFLLLVIGMLYLYSSSWNYALQKSDNGMAIVLRQGVWIIAGLFIAAALTYFDYHKLAEISNLIIFGTILMLAVVLFIPSNIQGATRTVLSGSVQPSELAKLALILYLAFWLSNKQDRLTTLVWGLLPVFSIIGLLALLILLQPDVSATITIVVLGSIMFFVGGGNLKHIGVLVLIGLFMSFFGYFLFSKVSERINDFLNGLMNPNLASYHIQRSTEAILRGGWFGVGLGKGVVKLTGLPVAWTDSIFSVVLEESGLFGGMVFIALYMVILWRGYEISLNAPDIYGKLLAAGVTLWITIEAVLNIGVMVNIFPFAGNALPLVSYGGSSMICTLAALGILLSVSRVSAVESLKKERTTPDAFISLRRWDWGWRVSSLSRGSRKK